MIPFMLAFSCQQASRGAIKITLVSLDERGLKAQTHRIRFQLLSLSPQGSLQSGPVCLVACIMPLLLCTVSSMPACALSFIVLCFVTCCFLLYLPPSPLFICKLLRKNKSLPIQPSLITSHSELPSQQDCQSTFIISLIPLTLLPCAMSCCICLLHQISNFQSGRFCPVHLCNQYIAQFLAYSKHLKTKWTDVETFVLRFFKIPQLTC